MEAAVQILRTHDVLELTGLSRTTIWRLERGGRFPMRFRLSENSVGWDRDEVLRWIESRPRGLSGSRSKSASESTQQGEVPPK